MVIILNELSMAGQFSQDTFISGLPNMIRLFKVFRSLKLQLSKKTDFYNCKVIQEIRIRDFITQTKADEIVRLKSTLVHLTDSNPFWDLEPKHSCKDSYIYENTTDTCNYGLAEATETDLLVFSFIHDQFTNNKLLLLKNGEPVSINNVFDLPSLVTCLFIHYPNFDFKNIVVDGIDKKDFFPNRQLSELLFYTQNIEEDNVHVNPDERIKNFKDIGTKIAKINLWQYCEIITRKNDRNIFKRRIQTANFYISIDTQHGRFELFDQSGIHLAEYYFLGVSVPNSCRNRTITV